MVENPITLRNAAPEDIEFLARLYSDTRQQEVAAFGWPLAQQEMFLRMQFDAQCRSYHGAFPEAIDHIVCLDGSAIGRMLVGREPAGMRLIDFALLAEHRNRGIGTGLLRRLLQECEDQGMTLRLQVLQDNPAIRLYQRLGFVENGSDLMYIQMEQTPQRSQQRS